MKRFHFFDTEFEFKMGKLYSAELEAVLNKLDESEEKIESFYSSAEFDELKKRLFPPLREKRFKKFSATIYYRCPESIPLEIWTEIISIIYQIRIEYGASDSKRAEYVFNIKNGKINTYLFEKAWKTIEKLEPNFDKAKKV